MATKTNGEEEAMTFGDFAFEDFERARYAEGDFGCRNRGGLGGGFRGLSGEGDQVERKEDEVGFFHG